MGRISEINNKIQKNGKSVYFHVITMDVPWKNTPRSTNKNHLRLLTNLSEFSPRKKKKNPDKKYGKNIRNKQ